MKEINDLYVPKTAVKSIDGFSGFCLGERGGGSVLIRAENISDRAFPSVCPRPRRATLGKYGKITAAVADTQLVRIENGVLFDGETKIMEGYFFDNIEHKIMKVGNYFVVMPMCAYFSIVDSTDFGIVSSSFTMGTGGAEIATVDKNFNVISEYTVLGTRPTGALDGNLWAKPKEDGGYEMMIYEGHEWYPYESYVRVKWPALAKNHRAGEVLECTGVDREIGKYIRISYTDDQHIYFAGAAPHLEKITKFSLSRKRPILQQSTLLDGRIVGVFCGYDNNGKFISKAYASARNNPISWSEYDGALSVDIGGCEEFTAITEYRGEILAFTENSIVRLKISDEKITASTIKCEGVKKRDGKSVVCIDGTVYYKGRNGVYAYDGAFPKKISSSLDKDLFFTVPAPLSETTSSEEQLGGDRFIELLPGVELAVCHSPAGAYNGKYYIRLEGKKEKSNIYVYNTLTKCWSVEDDPGVTEFLNMDGELMAVCKDGDGSKLILWDYDGADTSNVERFAKDGYPTVEDRVRWFFETGKTFADIKTGMSPTRIFLNARIKAGGSIGVGCIYNEDSSPRRIVSVSDRQDGVFEIPLAVTKCDSVRLAVFGSGDAEVLGYGVELSSYKG